MNFRSSSFFVSQVSTTASLSEIIKARPHHSARRPGRAVPLLLGSAALALLILEVTLVSMSFDAWALRGRADPNAWQRVLSYSGDVSRIGLVAAFVALLLIKDRLPAYSVKLEQALPSWRLAVLLGANVLSYCLFFVLTRRIFGSEVGSLDEATSWTYVAWLSCGLATVAFWTLAVAGPRLTGELLRAEHARLGIALVVALGVWFLALKTQGLWGPLSHWTFMVSASLLAMIEPESLVLIADEKSLGLGRFVVSVDTACSGYEGIGLVCVFTALYLYVYRRELRFPRVLLLFPIGAGAIWLLNGVRIAALVAIGHYWSPEVAIGGFHSHAGWLTFIAVSLLILWLAGGSAFFRKQVADSGSGSMNVAAATLVPLVCLLAVSLLSSALAGDFDWLYPLRVAAVAVALYAVWPHIRLTPSRPSWEAVAAGVGVALLWAWLLGSDDDYNEAFSAALAGVSPLWAGAWLTLRFLGAALTVPIAEELAFRGYLLCRLSRVPVAVRGRLPFSLLAVAISSLAFGALHGDWIAATLAGAVYALVRLRSESISDAITAHALTNALLFGYALATDTWNVI